MPPQIVLIRHAQAFHNIDHTYYIPDPLLSDTGVEQCKMLRQSLKDRFDSPSLDPTEIAIVASPMRRTLQTAQLATDWLMDRGVKIIANADWQENSSKPCDTGSAVEELAGEFPHVDFTHVDPVWPDKTSPAGQAYAYNRIAVTERGQRCLETLYRRPEKLIFVISHSGFLRLGLTGRWFFNSDYRIFDLDSTDDGKAKLGTQHRDTVNGGLGLSWTETVEIGTDLPE